MDQFLEQRLEMVRQQCVRRGISDKRVLAELRRVPRERFVPEELRNEAYADKPLELAQGQSISQPYMVGWMTEALGLKGTERVLEIGTGSGYQTAILAGLCAEVFTIEILEALAQDAKSRLQAMDYSNIFYQTGDGYLGWPSAAPFDCILIAAAVSDAPAPLIAQLADGGRMVAPIGGRRGRICLFHKTGAGVKIREGFKVHFVPMTGIAQHDSKPPRNPHGLPWAFELIEEFSGGEGWSGRIRLAGKEGEEQFLKVLPPKAEIREASLLASLHHPRIPKILEVGRCGDGQSYLLREYVDGRTVDRCFPLETEDALDFAIQILEVLAYVHLRGILHLDLKPLNVLQREHDGRHEYVLLDFGLGGRALAAGRGGTPFFASPEQLLGLSPGPYSDLFSLGAMLVLALRHAATPLPLGRFLERFPNEDFFSAIGIQARDFPSPFDEFLPRLLVRNPAERFADAQEALEYLTGTSGRPTLSVLAPDPITSIGQGLVQILDELDENQSLEITDGDPEDRRTLALHLACLGSSVKRMEEAKNACILRRGADRSLTTISVQSISSAELSKHLASVTSLDRVSANEVALAFLDAGINSPAAVGRHLQQLAKQRQILPDGPRWIWPNAASGRWKSEQGQLVDPSPQAIKLAASRGNPEAALEGYQRVLQRQLTDGIDEHEELSFRTALIEGLLLAGEAARALPLTHDLPVQRARCLFDLGQVKEAENLLHAHATEAKKSESLYRRLEASIAFSRADLALAEKKILQVVNKKSEIEGQIIYGLVLSSSGREREGAQTLRTALESLTAKDHPFLRAAALTNLGEVCRQLRQLEDAFASHTEALRLFQSIGHVRYTATASSNLGVLCKDLGRYEEARSWQRRARSLYQHIKDRKGAAVSEGNLGIIAQAQGNATAAKAHIERAVDELSELGALQAARIFMDLLPKLHDLQVSGESGAQAQEADSGVSGDHGVSGDPGVSEDRGAHGSSTMSPTHSDSYVPKEVFRTFLAVNRRLAEEADLDRAMHYLLDAAVTLLGGRIGYILVQRENGVRLEFRAGDSNQLALAFSRSLVNRSIQQKRTLDADDVLNDRELMAMPSIQGLKVKSALCAPFVCSSGTRGALYVEHPGRPGAFSGNDREKLEVLADQAAIAVERMLNHERLATQLEMSQRDLQIAKRTLRDRSRVEMLGKSEAFDKLEKEIKKLAATELSILILGETGTGKELVARSIHDQSTRSAGPFVAENCSAIPENLAESELFGHRKGSFTGADEDKKGLLELANDGTVFLDEIGDMPMSIQAKLLRALQDRKIRMVGGSEEIPIEIRVVAATHQDLRKMVAEGRFREDLYYRIAAVELRVPPLRERDKDALLLAETFLDRLCKKHNRKVSLAAKAKSQILEYAWPGNIRELEHLIARAFILQETDTLEELELPETIGSSQSANDVEMQWPVIKLQEAEERTIRAVLASTGGDKTKAAKILSISRTALYEKLKRMKSKP